MTQPTLRPDAMDMQPGPPPSRKKKSIFSGIRSMMRADHPIWTVFPILLSVAALYFAYKSNIINREWADVHLRLNTQIFMGYRTSDDYFIQDDAIFFPSVIGSLDNIEELMSQVTMASNTLGLRWTSEAVGMEFNEEVDITTLPYSHWFIFLAICNDGDQIAESSFIDFDYYQPDDQDELRGDVFIPEGAETSEWAYGPFVLSPGQWTLVPLGTVYMRYTPLGEETDIQYHGDFYLPKLMRYQSAVSGEHEIPLNFEAIPMTMNVFTDPPIPQTEGTQSEMNQPSQPLGRKPRN